MKTYKKGDLVQRYEDKDKINGIVLDARKKERSHSKSKHMIEIVVGQVVDVMWANGTLETDVRIEDLHFLGRPKDRFK